MVACLRHSIIVCRRTQVLHTELSDTLSLKLRMCLRTMRPGLGHVSYGFAGTIVPDDERERLVELDDVGIVRTEAPNALY